MKKGIIKLNTEVVGRASLDDLGVRKIILGKDVVAIESDAFSFTCIDTVEIEDINNFFNIHFGNYYSCPAIWVRNVITSAGKRIRHIDEFSAYQEWLDYYRLEYGDDEFKDFYENEAHEILISSIAEDPKFAKNNGFDLTENELKLILLEVELSSVTFCGCRSSMINTGRYHCTLTESICIHEKCGSRNCPIFTSLTSKE